MFLGDEFSLWIRLRQCFVKRTDITCNGVVFLITNIMEKIQIECKNYSMQTRVQFLNGSLRAYPGNVQRSTTRSAVIDLSNNKLQTFVSLRF